MRLNTLSLPRVRVLISGGDIRDIRISTPPKRDPHAREAHERSFQREEEPC